jgi:tRNA A-37 threonylcarbamoyl transferase component Bud32
LNYPNLDAKQGGVVAIIHPVGEPADNCERKVIDYLKVHLPDSFHVYHNLELIPRRGGHPYEYDVIVVGELFACVVEVKGYQGIIRGNARMWKLANGRFEPSPIPLTNNKARILKNNIVRYALRFKDRDNGVYVDALIVLCYARTKVELNDPQADRVVHLPKLVAHLIAREKAWAHSNPDRDESSIICSMLDQRFGPWSFERRVGEYIVDDTVISRSKHSVTYAARHATLRSRNRVSLRVFRLETSLPKDRLERRKQMFLRDAEVLSMLGEHPHENVVRCYAPFLWQSDKIVLPMEWIDGLPLRDLLNEGMDWSFQQRLEIFRQVCEGLAHAHRHGIIHRALSPENIIVLQSNKVKLVNFKFAKIEYATMFTIASAGTWYSRVADRRYMAPELRSAPHEPTSHSDIFSAGVVLFELMTGQCPFSKRRPIQPDTPLEGPTAFIDGLPPDIDDIFLKMCCFDSNKRCATMEDVLVLIGATIIP